MTRRQAWVPLVAATAGTLLLIKGVLIIASSDRVADAPMVVMYFGGILVGIAAAIGFGLRQERRLFQVLVSVGGVLLLLAWMVGLGGVLNPISEALSDAKYVRDELPVAVAGGVLLLLAALAFINDTKVTGAVPRRKPVPA
jgi:hypothetical protein